MRRLTAAAFVIATLASAGGAVADTRQATIQPGKPARIHVVTALKKDCSQGDAGTIRVTTPPKNGSTMVQGSKLKTPSGFRCPNVETQVQQLIYAPKKDFTGTDEVTFETRDADGTTASHTIRINVTAKPGAPAPKGSGGVVDL